MGLGLVALFTACGPLPLEGPAPTDTRVDSSGVLAEFDGGRPLATAGAATPSARITAPTAGTRVAEHFRIEGSASDDRAVTSVFVRVGPNQAVPAQSSDGFESFSVESAAPFGRFE